MAGTGSIELVIGASGYLGSHVTRQLVARGDRVRVLARKSSSPAAFDDLDVEIRYGDLADREALRSAMCGPAKDEVADENFEFNWAKEGDEYVRTRVEARTWCSTTRAIGACLRWRCALPTPAVPATMHAPVRDSW